MYSKEASSLLITQALEHLMIFRMGDVRTYAIGPRI